MSVRTFGLVLGIESDIVEVRDGGTVTVWEKVGRKGNV